MCITSMAITLYGGIQRIPDTCKGSIKVFCVSMRHMLSKAVVLEAFSLMFDWHKTFPRKSEILMFIYLTFDQCSRGELYQCLDLHFLFILFTQCLFKQFCKKKWKLRCKYCILKWRVWKLHIHARVVNIFGSGLKSVILF